MSGSLRYMITIKELDKLPTERQMFLCNTTAILLDVKTYTHKEIIKIIPREFYEKVLLTLNNK